MRLTHKLLVCTLFGLIIAAYVSLLPAPGVARTTLANGLRVVVIRTGTAPVASVSLTYLAGSRESPPGFPGTAHAVEHMMFRGSPGLTADQINAILGSLGGVSNAYTGPVSTEYVATVPSGDLEILLRLEAVRMRGILADEGQWRLERDAISQEAAMVFSSSGYRVLAPLAARLFAGTPYADDPVGTPASLAGTAPEMLRRFHREWYPPNNALLVITGDVAPSRTLRTVQRIFGDIPPRPLPRRALPVFPPLCAGEAVIRGNLSSGVVLLAGRLPGSGHRDYAAARVLAAALDTPRSRIARLTEEEGLLMATVESRFLPETGALIVMAAVPAGDPLRATAGLLRRVIASCREEGIPADLVEAVKRRALTLAAADGDSIPTLAGAWSRALLDGYATPDEEAAAIRKVTAADVTRVARTWLRDDRLLALLSPAGSGGAAAVTARSVPRRGESLLPRGFAAVPLPPWAGGVNRLPPLPPERPPAADLRLPNGLRLIVVRSGRSGIVTLSGRVRNNPLVQVPPGQEGIDFLLEEMLARGESCRRDSVQFREALDRLGATAEVGTELHLTVAGGRFEEGVALVAEALIRPSFPARAFATVRNRAAGELAGQRTDPEWVGWLARQRALYPPGDPELRHETSATIRRLTRDKLQAYHAAVVRPDMTTLVITGDLDPAVAMRIVMRQFGGWRAAGPPPVIELPPVPDNRPVAIHLSGSGGDQVTVTLAQTSRLSRRDPDYYPFQLGMRVLAGSSASRLYQHVREQEGLVYDITAEFRAARSRSLFSVEYETDAGHVAAVRRLVEADLADLQTRPVSRAELTLALNCMSRELLLADSGSDEIAAGILQLVNEGLPLDLPARAARQIRQVTPQQVQGAFSRWLRLKGLAEVRSGGR